MCVLNLVFSASSFSLHNILYVLLVSLFATLLFIAHTRYASQRTVTVLSGTVLALCLCLAVMSLPVAFLLTSVSKDRIFTPADGLWQTMLIVFGTYTMLPLQLFVVAPVAIGTSLLHVFAAFLLNQDVTYWSTWQYVGVTSRPLPNSPTLHTC